VIIYWQVDATHSGDFLGFPATDKQISIRGSTMAIILDNKFVEARDHWDVKHLIDQIS
jgi:predicted ester cyclase